MSFTTDCPYNYDVFTVKQLGEHIVKIAYVRAIRESGWELENDEQRKAPCEVVNTDKLANNLCRAKTTVRELVLCNPWDYWCTFTISPDKYERKDLKTYFSDFAEFLHNYNRRCTETEKVRYLLVPEKHKDECWHMHGFIRGIRQKDLYTNRYGYLTWRQYEDKFGFISMSLVHDLERSSSYILKYMTKDSNKNVTARNAHTYYASKGLKRAVELYRGSGVFRGLWDWEDSDGFCKIKTIDLRKEKLSDYLEVMK